jgi:hypothetical protein
VLYDPDQFERLTDEPWDASLTGDVGTALFAAACLDIDARYPILDIV